MTTKSENGTQRISLGVSLEMGTAPALHEELKSALEANDALDIDGSEVQRIDSASLQVLIAMFVHADRYQRSVTLAAPSEELMKAAKQLGLEKYIS